MPFRSKAQARWMFWAEKKGKVKKGTAKRWAEETPDIEDLPERVSRTKKRASKKRRKER